MSRTRAYRRAQRERVIARRLRHIRQWDYGLYMPPRYGRPERRQNDYWGHDVPGRWAKQDPYVHGRCGVCSRSLAEMRDRLLRKKPIDADVAEEYLHRSRIGGTP